MRTTETRGSQHGDDGEGEGDGRRERDVGGYQAERSVVMSQPSATASRRKPQTVSKSEIQFSSIYGQSPPASPLAGPRPCI